MPRGTVDVVVAGLGAMGAAIAWQAAARGMDVVGCDPLTPPHDRGSTHGHSRIIREAYFEHPQYVPLVRRAYELWNALEAETGTRLFEATGGIMIGHPDGVVVPGTRRAADVHTVPIQVWSADELRHRITPLSPMDDMLAVVEPRAGVLAPEAAVTAMIASARRAGATLLVGEGVREWRQSGDVVDVQTDRHAVKTRALVLAAGPWVSTLLGPFPSPLTVERVVQYWYDTSADDRFTPARFPVFLLEAPDGRVLYGLPDQGHGLKLAEHHGGRIVDPESVDRRVDAEEQRRFHQFASRWVNGLPAAASDARVCLYTNTADGDFILDWHPAAPGVFVCSACSGHGFKFAPAIGEAVSAMVAGDPVALDLMPFRVTRFVRGGG